MMPRLHCVLLLATGCQSWLTAASGGQAALAALLKSSTAPMVPESSSRHSRLVAMAEEAVSRISSAGPPAHGAPSTWNVHRDQIIIPAARVSSLGAMGSGMVISVTDNGTYVLTNHHVIEDSIQQLDRWDPAEKSSKKVERTLPVDVETFTYDLRGRHIQTVTTSAEIVAYAHFGDKWDFDGDLALLRLNAPVAGMLAANVISEEDFLNDVRVLDDVIMMGCPKASQIPMPTKGHIASITEELAGVGLLLSQLLGNPGSSGSAVYRWSPEREIFEIIAVHSMRDPRGSLTDQGTGNFLRLATQAPVIHEFLKKHGFGHLLSKSDADSEQGQDETNTTATLDASNTTAAVDGSNTSNGNLTASTMSDNESVI